MTATRAVACESDAATLGSRSQPWDVLIVGAGVGGAALALALVSHFDLRVCVIDRRSGPGNINRGDSLLPAVTGALRAWGALPALLAAGARPVQTLQVFHPQHGLLLEAPLSAPAEDDPQPAPYLVLAHPDIERALVQTAQHGAYNRGRAQVTYRSRFVHLLRAHGDRGRICGARVHSEHGEQDIHARVVIGADGAASKVRSQLGLSLPTTPYDHSYYILECARPSATSGRGAYHDAMRIELSRHGGILVVPQGPDRLGLGVLVRAADSDLFRAGAQAEKLAAIAQRSPLLHSLGQPGGLAAYMQGAHLYALHRGHAPHYHRDGSVLIGDAIHVTNPTAGQGMTMAIEDAAALARHLGPVLTTPRAASDSARCDRDADLDRALVAYQRERWPQNDAQIGWSHWLSRFYAWEGPLADRVHTQIFRLGASSLGQHIQRLIWSRLATRAPLPTTPAWITP